MQAHKRVRACMSENTRADKCTCTFTHSHMCTHVFTCVCIYICAHMCACMRMYTCMCAHSCACVRAHTACIYTHAHACTYTCICMHTYVCVHLHTCTYMCAHTCDILASRPRSGTRYEAGRSYESWLPEWSTPRTARGVRAAGPRSQEARPIPGWPSPSFPQRRGCGAGGGLRDRAS